MKLKKQIKILFKTLALSSVMVMGFGPIAQAAETFSVDNKALNTNWGFSRLDGNPRMSIWDRNDNDPDQQFDRIPGNLGGTLLKHRSTGMCLNAHYLWNGAEINLWSCNGNDPDQNFNIVDVGGGKNLIRRNGTNLCVDSPTRDNTGKIYLWDCNSNNGNQRWLTSAYVASPTPVQSPTIIRKQTTNLVFGRGTSWYSPNRRHQLVFQNDGNLVIYSNGNAVWATGTHNTATNQLAFQADGNLVLYNSGKAVWASDTSGKPVSHLAIQDDGNIVIYGTNNQALFATMTFGNNTGRFSESAEWLKKQAQPQPSGGGVYYRNFEGFINFAVGQKGISRLDRSDLKGQCVTLIARYIQEVYLTGADRTKQYAW
jgi:Ricin-type beta-trefoil lectin domain